MHRRVRRDRAAGPARTSADRCRRARDARRACRRLRRLAGCAGRGRLLKDDHDNLGELRLFALRLFKLRRVSVVGGQGGELRRVHALARAHRLPQPSLGSNGLPNFSSGNSDLSPQPPHCHAAQGACKKDLPNLGPQTPAEEAAANAEALKHAGCIQSDGEPDFPHPDGQGLIQVKNATVILQLVGRPSGSS